MPTHETVPAVHDAACRNCAAILAGPYCAQCGQHAHESARSLRVLFHDAWHLLTHLDGRLWETLVPLLVQPGRLTQEYFEDHRARYVPPFRLYFVISVIFFALASLTSTVSNMATTRSVPLSTADRAELQRELQESGAPAAVTATVEDLTDHPMNSQLAAQLCTRVASAVPWADQRLQAVCKHQLADQGKSMLHAFGSLVPKMMFVFLPLMALVMLALYHSPPRHYVEHLVFFLHLQSNLFLVMILAMLLGAAAAAWPVLDTMASLGGMVLFGYAIWYVCFAMRNYYGQPWPRTLLKIAVVVSAYSFCFLLSLTGTLVLSALVT
jgi:Protein of unknown function (DUF3667)